MAQGADAETYHVAEGDADTNEEESVPPATTPLQGEGGVTRDTTTIKGTVT